MSPVAVQILRILEHFSPPEPHSVSSGPEETSDNSREFQRISKPRLFLEHLKPYSLRKSLKACVFIANLFLALFSDENCALLGCYAASSSNCRPTFRETYRLHLKGSTLENGTHKLSGRTVALGLTQRLTEMSTRNISWGSGDKGGRCVGLTTLPPSGADCLEI
jgi:hypothetical protein